MHKSATKCNETIGKWCKNKHGASKIIDTLETYHRALHNDAYYLIDAQAPKKDKVDRSEEETKRPWNIALLRPFYS
jgi:hypothetical protein